MIQYLNVFFYDIYPYICATVFFLGSWLRYDYGQYTWRASSSQMLDKRGMVIWSNLFHIGILGIFFGHLFGMLTPHWMYAWFLPVAAKQLMAMVLGGICGVLTLIGGAGLLWRRLTNQRVRATSTTPDIIIMSILLIQCLLGLSTIPFSAQYPDGSEMMKLVGWAQSIVTFRGGSSEMLNGVAFVFRLHLVLGMTIFLLFPFTRLVHVWSAPFEYFTRRYSIKQKLLCPGNRINHIPKGSFTCFVLEPEIITFLEPMRIHHSRKQHGVQFFLCVLLCLQVFWQAFLCLCNRDSRTQTAH